MESTFDLAPLNGNDPRDRWKPVVEALIFAAHTPLDAAHLLQVIEAVAGEEPGCTEADVAALVEQLNRDYARTGRAFRIQAWGGGYRMATEPRYVAYLDTLFHEEKKLRLSRSLLETLVILAYKQPVTKPEIDFVRGVDADYALRRLLELELIDIVGRSETVGKPLLYGTTAKFLDQFGLQNLDGLPNLREIEELLNDPGFNKERAQLLLKAGLGESLDTGAEAAGSTEPTAPSSA